MGKENHVVRKDVNRALLRLAAVNQREYARVQKAMDALHSHAIGTAVVDRRTGTIGAIAQRGGTPGMVTIDGKFAALSPFDRMYLDSVDKQSDEAKRPWWAFWRRQK